MGVPPHPKAATIRERIEPVSSVRCAGRGAWRRCGRVRASARRGLRGRLSGLGQPAFVKETPGGGGEVAVGQGFGTRRVVGCGASARFRQIPGLGWGGVLGLDKPLGWVGVVPAYDKPPGGGRRMSGVAGCDEAAGGGVGGVPDLDKPLAWGG
jgi:hypothetical protein